MDETLCPTCEEEYDSRRAMKIHHVQAHDRSISGKLIECGYCGESARIQQVNFDKAENNFCSRECYGKWRSENIHGEQHPMYNQIEVECENCGTTVSKHPSSVREMNFCSNECHHEINTVPTGPDSPHWEGGEVTVVCQNCGVFFKKPPKNARKAEKHFCSDKCWVAWSKVNHARELNPNWKGGSGKLEDLRRTLPGPSWETIRNRVREDADYKCKTCKTHESTLDTELHVHHLVPLLGGGSNHPDNLIALCAGCHKKAEAVAADICKPILTESR